MPIFSSYTVVYCKKREMIPAFWIKQKKAAKYEEAVVEIRYSRQAIKFLEKQEESIRIRIKNAIIKLPAGDVKKLIGQPYYRLRVGNFRVLFTRDGHIIEVSKIDNRGQIYK